MLLKSCLIFLFALCPQLAFSDTEGQTLSQEQKSFLEDDSESTPTTPSNAPNMTGLLIKTIIILGGLCGIVFAGAHFLRRMGGSQFNSFRTDGSIRLVERKYLSPKTSVWLVEVNNQSFLVVDSQQQTAIQLVKTSTPKEGEPT